MPYFTRKIEPNGLILNVQVGVSAEREASLQKNSLPVPTPVVVKGIIDTGASSTCIDPAIAQQPGLESKGEIATFTPSTGDSPAMMDQYDVSVMIYRTEQETPFYVANLAVIESKANPNCGYQMLIGRDILSQCMLVYDGANEWYSLAF